MRLINKIILHCTATPEGKEYNAQDITAWHVRQNGWQDIGYHFVIKLNGVIEVGRPLDLDGSHCQGHNKNSIGIVYVGGLDKNGLPKDTRTPMQKIALKFLINSLLKNFNLSSLHIYGHNEFNINKQCPCFDVKEFIKLL